MPAVELADRLRRVPLFDFTHVDELFRLARLGRQVRYEKGRAVYERGEVVTSIQFLLDGRVTVTGAHDIEAPAALGFEELLEGSPMPASITAADRAITLSLTADEFLALLSENVELAEGIFRMLIESRRLATGQTLIHGTLPPDMKDAAHLRPVDNLLLLQSSPLLAHATARAIVAAVGDRPRTDHRRERRGARQGQRGGDPDRVVGIAARRGKGPAGHGDSRRRDRHVRNAGRIAARCRGHRHHGDARAAHRSRGLFELLADHTDLLQGMFSMLLRSAGKATSNTVSTP